MKNQKQPKEQIERENSIIETQGRTAHERIEQDRGEARAAAEIEQSAKKDYKYGAFSRLPAIVKSLLLKFWFAGAAYYFIIMGISALRLDTLDETFALGLVLGLLIDLIVSPWLEMTDGAKQDIHKFIMVRLPKKQKAVALILNILYALVVCFSVTFLYGGINLFAISAGWASESEVWLKGEPIGYALSFIAIDLALIGIRNLVKYLIERRRHV